MSAQTSLLPRMLGRLLAVLARAAKGRHAQGKLPPVTKRTPGAEGMRVFVIRHAEPYMRQGPDPVLTPLGREQAERLARAFQGRKLDRVVCSTMRRAVETATPLSEATGAPLVREAALVEIDLGELWVFEPAEEAEWAQVCDQWRAGDFAARPRGGESLAEVIDRVEPIVRRVVAEGCELGVAIIGHAVVNGVILPLLCPELRPRLGDDLGHSYTGVWEVEGESAALAVVRRDDTRHLGPAGLGPGGSPEPQGARGGPSKSIPEMPDGGNR